jgi:serine/threonine protein kinase/Tol biopolymer transport system component
MIGEWIGQYRIVEIIGQGGMSTVYKATQPTFGRDVAIKILPRQFLEDPTFIKRFQREARMIAHLEHRSILPVYDYGEHDGVPYIVMRLMEAGTLRRKLFYDGVTLSDTMRIIEEVAEALDYAHSRGIIHRDLKPSNILLDENGDAYLTDFGIAKMLGSTSQVTGSGVVGTPNYMSPEQCQGKTLGPTSDIYALGTILFEIITGTPPFEAELPLTVMYMHVRDPIPSAYQRNPGLPPEIDTVIQKALTKRPEYRYQTARELASEFRQVVQNQRVAAAPPPPPVQQRPPAPPPSDGPSFYDERDNDDNEMVVTGTPDSLGAYEMPDYGYLPESSNYEYPTPTGTMALPRATLLTLVGGVLIVALMLGAAGLGLTAMSGREDGSPFPTVPPFRTAGAQETEQLIPTTAVAFVPSDTPFTPGGIIEPSNTPVNTFPVPATVVPVGPTRVPSTPTNVVPTWTLVPTWTPSSTPTPTSSPSATPTITNTPLPTGGWGLLVYTQGFGNGAEIAVVDANGANFRQLTNNAIYDGEPDWSSDASKIAFGSAPGGSHDIFTMNADGSGVTKITDTPDQDERNPDWSPNGQLIAFEAGPEDSAELYVVNADGTELTKLTDNTYGDRAPQFSPDGKRIAFMTQARGKWEIAIMKVSDLTVTTIYDCPASGCRFPTWSPDGNWIAFNTITSSVDIGEIWEIYIPSGAMSRLVAGPDKGRPVYSDDAQFCFFNGDAEDGNTDLYRINLATNVIERLTTGSASEYAPDWGPQ